MHGAGYPRAAHAQLNHFIGFTSFSLAEANTGHQLTATAALQLDSSATCGRLGNRQTYAQRLVGLGESTDGWRLSRGNMLGKIGQLICQRTRGAPVQLGEQIEIRMTRDLGGPQPV